MLTTVVVGSDGEARQLQLMNMLLIWICHHYNNIHPEGDHENKDGGCKGDSDDNETANAVGGVDDESFCGTRPLTISQYSSSNQNHMLSERDKKAMT